MNSFLLCVEFSRREMNAWSPGLVSGVTMGPGTGVRSKVPPSLLPSLSDNILAQPPWPGYWVTDKL